MAKPVQQVQGRSLWGRLVRGQSRRERAAAPVASVPTHRPLTTRDVLWALDSQTARRVYLPLSVDGVPGRWAGREWHHCGEADGVLLVRWNERDNPMAVQHPRMLADGAVCVIEGGQLR